MTEYNHTWPALDELLESLNGLQGIGFRLLQISLEDDKLKVSLKVVQC